MFKKCINVVDSVGWTHHRSGWNYVLGLLNNFQFNSGIDLFGYGDGNAKKSNTKEKWIGFFHNTPYHHGKEQKYSKVLGLHDVLTHNVNLNTCKGIFTLCDYTKSFIEENFDVTVCSLPHPVDNDNYKQFDLNKLDTNYNIVHVGHWMRNFEYFCSLNHPRKKLLLTEHTSQRKDLADKNLSSVDLLQRLDNHEYDNLLSCTPVFLNMYDVAAANTIIECIVRNTPLFINRLPAAVEYLGENYPLFYDSVAEAEQKSNSLDMVLKGYYYLKEMDKEFLSGSYFLKKFEESVIMRRLIKEIKFL